MVNLSRLLIRILHGSGKMEDHVELITECQPDPVYLISVTGQMFLINVHAVLPIFI
jgi:hypothetical protein